MDDLGELVAALRSGKPLLVPTDTVIGIAVDPSVPGAVDSVFALKGRPSDKPLPVLGPDAAGLTAVANFTDEALLLAERFWPGPLTIVLPRAPGFTTSLGQGSERSVAVRVPRSPRLQQLLAVSGPLAVTSANPSGLPPTSDMDEARATFGTETPFLSDEGLAGSTGESSTVLSLLGAPEILRAGTVSDAAIADCLRSSG